MLNVLSSLLTEITMYRLMLIFMIVLVGAAFVFSLAGILPYNPWNIARQAVLFVLSCWILNKGIARILKVQPNRESSLITGLILSAIMGPFSLPEQWLPLVVSAVAAIGSKYLLVYRRSHVFNPAAFGALASGLLLGQPASWWIGSAAMAWVTVIGGLVMIRKIRRFHLVGIFLSIYLGLLILDALIVRGSSLAGVGLLVQNLFTFSPLLFFSAVMLVEPLTAPQTLPRRTAFGALVGIVLFVLQRFASFLPYSLELSLLVGNAFARIINPDFRQAFALCRTEFVDSAIGMFWFEPTRQFAFAPGQFLEYTLGHPRADARGVRRYFTIASSPTEAQVLLTSRFSDPGSTFKQALRGMKEGDEIVASKVGGEFTLPKDQKQKLCFIAGGIGITPYRSIVKYLLDKNQPRDIVLIYGCREEKDLVFRDVFEEAGKKFGMKNVYVLSDVTRASTGWQGRTGMIDEKLIREEVPGSTERLFYVSGPEPMVQAIIKMLSGMGIPRRKIKRDYFPGYAQ